MSINGRIIAGKYRHRPIVVMYDEVTRSTKDRVKEGLFSALSNDLKDAVVLDLFAGSGALGIEALSRGSASVIFCELDRKVFSVLEKNVHFVEENIELHNLDYKEALKRIQAKTVDIVFLDPPYALDINIVVGEVMNANILKEKFIFVLETDKEFTASINNAKIKKYKYGLTHITIIRGE